MLLFCLPLAKNQDCPLFFRNFTRRAFHVCIYISQTLPPLYVQPYASPLPILYPILGNPLYILFPIYFLLRMTPFVTIPGAADGERASYKAANSPAPVRMR